MAYLLSLNKREGEQLNDIPRVTQQMAETESDSWCVT